MNEVQLPAGATVVVTHAMGVDKGHVVEGDYCTISYYEYSSVANVIVHRTGEKWFLGRSQMEVVSISPIYDVVYQ